VLIIALLSGIVSIFSFEPFWYLPLIFIGYSTFYYLVLKAKSKKYAFFIGLYFGIGYFGAGTWWLFSIPDNKSAILLFGSGVILIMALYQAIFALITYYLKLYNRYAFLIFAPVIATILEYLRAYLFSGFTWLRVSDALFFVDINFIYSTFGSLGVTFIFYSFITLISFLIFYKSKKIVLLFAIWIIVVLTISLSLKQNKKLIPKNKELNVAIFSGDYNNEDKTNRYKILKNIDYYIKKGFESNTTLIILPESAVSVELQDIKGYLKQKFKVLKKENQEILFGGYYNAENLKLYNAVIKATSLKPVYIKNHLIPFGEYIPKPFRYIDSIIPRFRMNNISKGDNNYTFRYKEFTFLSTICYELLFELEWQNRVKKSDVLLNISDIGWFKNSWAAPYMLKVAQIRAAEFAKPLIYSVNKGKSAYILPTGEIAQSTNRDNDVIYITVTTIDNESFYTKYGLKALLLLIILWFIIILLSKKILKGEL